MARARRDLPEAAFNRWFADLRPGGLKGEVLELIVPSSYVKNWLAAHHMDLITASAREVLGPAAKVRLKLERPKRAEHDPSAEGDRGASEGGRATATSQRRRARGS